jgi:hypothetical protein
MADRSISGGRLTVKSNEPVFTSGWDASLGVETEEAASNVIYWAPYISIEIALVTSGVWTDRQALTQPFLTLPAPPVNGRPMDVFAYWTGSAVGLDYAFWSSSTARATALTRLNGVLVKSGDSTRRYLGTVWVTTDGAGGRVTDSPSKRHVFNYYNKVMRKLEKEEAAASWVYNTQAWREANGKTDENIVQVLQGELDGTVVQLGIDQEFSCSQASQTNKGLAGIIRAAAGAPTNCPIIASSSWVAGARMSAHGYMVDAPDAIGLNSYRWVEFGSSLGNTTFYGGKKSGLRGVLWN